MRRVRVQRLTSFFASMSVTLLLACGSERLALEPATRAAASENVAPTAAPVAHEPGTLAERSSHVSIEMYTATWCGTCQRAKHWLSENHVAYQEIDIDRQPGAREQLRTLNPSRSIPTFDINGSVYVGFNPQIVTNMIRSAAP